MNDLQQILYISWGLWLLYLYLILVLKKNISRMPLTGTVVSKNPQVQQPQSQRTRIFNRYFVFTLLGKIPKMAVTFVGMFLSTVVIFALFFLLTQDFKADSNFFIKNYEYNINRQQKEIIIGNSETDTDIALENPWAAERHLKIILGSTNFQVQDISDDKKVDLNGRSLSQAILNEGDVIEIDGKEKIRVLKIFPQFALGRSLMVSMSRNGKSETQPVILHTLLNKRMPLGSKGAAYLEYIPGKQFLGTNIYYVIAFVLVFLLSAAIYLYLQGHFNGAFLLLMLVSLAFGAGYISMQTEGIIIVLFLPAIFYVEKKRKTHWKLNSVIIIILYIAVFFSPRLLHIDGDFTLDYARFSRKDTPAVKVIPAGTLIENETPGENKNSFDLFDKRESLGYGEIYEVILGHTRYRMRVDITHISLSPRDPEKIKIPRNFAAIIGDLTQVKPGHNYVYLKFPHDFNPISAKSIGSNQEINIWDAKGNGLTLSKKLNENYRFYLLGLILVIMVPFWLFWDFIYLYSFAQKRFKKKEAGPQPLRIENNLVSEIKRPPDFFNYKNFIVYNFVYFMTGIGYVVFGALALYNNNYFKNFAKYRNNALPFFVGFFLLLILLSRYNRFVVFLSRILRQRKYQVPLVTFLILLLAANYHKLFLAAGALFFIIVFGFRLRRILLFEFKSTHNYPLDIKKIIETPVCSFEEKNNRRMFFGLGELLNKKGWNVLLVADLLLLLALFFIVLQMFLGGELGLTVGGFLFFPIELGKILLAIYFADWVSRIDKGMEFNVLWVYALVLIPFLLLIVFLKDFSPLLIFVFVFFYHIIKIKKSLWLKLLLIVSALIVMKQSVVAFSNYTIPSVTFAVLFSVPVLYIIFKVWKKRVSKESGRWAKHRKIALVVLLVLLLGSGNYILLFNDLPVSRVLGDRMSSWLNPWQDYNLSYQYINALWLMKGTGTYGKTTEALTAAGRIPLVEKDLIFSLYAGTLGTMGIILLMLTIFLAAAVVFRPGGTAWHGYVLEFLAVIFLAQFLVPAMYTVGLLPLMGQPLPFLSYSNNLLLLFALPFSVLMFILSTAYLSESGITQANAWGKNSHFDQKFEADSLENPGDSNAFRKYILRAIPIPKSPAFLIFCLIILLLVLAILLRFYSIAYPKDIEEKTDIVYLESFDDFSSIFKLQLRDRQFELTPKIIPIQVLGKDIYGPTVIRNGDIISVGKNRFQFKVYPGEYIYKEVYCRPLINVFPGPVSVKYISGWSRPNRQQIFANEGNIEILKKTIVEIAPGELETGQVDSKNIPFDGPVLELSWKSGKLFVRPLAFDVVRVRELDEKKFPKDSFVPLRPNDILKIHPALYFKFDFREEEGEQCLVISYRHEQKYPTIPEPEAAVLKSLDTGITYDISLASETLFMGKNGLFSFNIDLSELMEKLYVPNKVPQGRVVDMKELLNRRMYYRKGEEFFPVTLEYLESMDKYIKKGREELQQYLEKNNIKWRNFKNYNEYLSYKADAQKLIKKMVNKGIYKTYSEEIGKLNNRAAQINAEKDTGQSQEEVFKVKKNKLYLVQKQARRAPTYKIKMLQKPTIMDAKGNILAYNSEINGDNRRFFTPDTPTDLLSMLKGNEEEKWALEQIFSRLYRENRIHEIRLTINRDWQKITLAAIRKVLLENRETEILNPKYLALKDEYNRVKAQLALMGNNQNLPLQVRLSELKKEMYLEKNHFYEAAVVLMDPAGRILTAASYPYDEQTLLELNPDLSPPFRRSLNPLLNRTWKWKYNPGSTAKILDSIAFLSSRDRFPYVDRLLSSPSAFAYFPHVDLLGSAMLNGKALRFHLRNFEGHVVPGGFCSLTQAFTHSYNTYFAYVALHTNKVLTDDSSFTDTVIKKSIVPISGFYKQYSILEYAEKLFLNREVNLLSNLAGTPIQYELQRMPHDSLIAAASVFPINAYRAADVAHYAIGQGDFQLTALQNAMISSTIFNDGALYFPSIINSITLRTSNNQPGEAITPDPDLNKIQVFPSDVASVIKAAMQEVVVRGTAAGVFGELTKDRVFYAKTGTAETGFSKDNALFTGFVEFQNKEQIIYSVIVPRSGLGARIAGKLTAQIINDIIAYQNKSCNPF
ncbi:MAG: penicillin-binding transpeptidase domain-containing protein [Acidobacteria bacterium]|jgi:cell division protein FtsI/penicillin-binding protein 2/cell division protein FtsW (lipid II flippase)|nr:penicillin-binding transpeptidase domain-containing protein [Acidobacteriota bacterium]